MRAWTVLAAALALLIIAPDVASATPTPPCSSAQLSTVPVSSTGAMGNELIVFRFRDDGSRCTLRGYPRVGPRTGSGGPLGVREVRTRRPFPGGKRFALRRLEIEQGGVAYFALGYRGYDYRRARRCLPLAPAIGIAPPAGGRLRTIPLPFAIGFCHRIVRVSPVVAKRP